jgi:hypothetical protein
MVVVIICCPCWLLFAAAQRHIRNFGGVITRFSVYKGFKDFFKENPRGVYAGECVAGWVSEWVSGWLAGWLAGWRRHRSWGAVLVWCGAAWRGVAWLDVMAWLG